VDGAAAVSAVAFSPIVIGARKNAGARAQFPSSDADDQVNAVVAVSLCISSNRTSVVSVRAKVAFRKAEIAVARGTRCFELVLVD